LPGTTAQGTLAGTAYHLPGTTAYGLAGTTAYGLAGTTAYGLAVAGDEVGHV
jgi:hypothetical protein